MREMFMLKRNVPSPYILEIFGLTKDQLILFSMCAIYK